MALTLAMLFHTRWQRIDDHTELRDPPPQQLLPPAFTGLRQGSSCPHCCPHCCTWAQL